MSSNFIRWCGLATLLGGVAFVLLLLGDYVVRRLLYGPADISTFPSTYVLDVSIILLLLNAMAAIAGLHTLQRKHYGAIASLSAFIAFLGVALLFVGAVILLVEDITGLTRCLDCFHPSTLLLRPSVLIMASIGLLFFTSATIAAKGLPWWDRWSGACLFLVHPFMMIPMIAIYEPLVLSVGVVWAVVGYAVFRLAEGDDNRPPNPFLAAIRAFGLVSVMVLAVAMVATAVGVLTTREMQHVRQMWDKEPGSLGGVEQ